MNDTLDTAHEYRALQAQQLLLSAGYFEHSDGNWYPEPETAPGEDD